MAGATGNGCAVSNWRRPISCESRSCRCCAGNTAWEGWTPGQVATAVDDLLDLELDVYPTGPLLRRAWQLRDNVTAYDACYVALAEALDCPLLTADARLSRAGGPMCDIELITA